MDAVSPTIPTALRPALQAYATRLRAIFGSRLRDVRLFGSFARGEADEESDVDVLVLIDDCRGGDVGLAAGEAGPVIVETLVPLAPLVLSTERFEALRRGERALAREIDEQGISL